jgi:2-aminoethylphosphonate-pyruvate transaminase
MGTRLRSAVQGMPKGLIEIGGETLVGRSTRLLRESGVERLTIVAGYAEDHYRRFAAGRSDIRIVVNGEYATTGSMASLAIALDGLDEDVLVLESDIIYESRALSTMMDGPFQDATLLSGLTGAGDEVWVHAPHGRVAAMGKHATALPGVDGEFVGITRLSAPAASAMHQAFGRFVAAHGHGRMDYESDALVEIARDVPVRAVLVPDLCWGEIDDEHHLDRVVREVWPALAR